MPIPIIVDFDNTMGVPACDVDDALALLHLLGCLDKVQVAGVCTCYGNSTVDVVHRATERLLDLWDIDIPLHRGAASAADPMSEAAAYLAESAAARPGEISVLATGSMTNLRGAALVDPAFFSNLRSVHVMGGIERSLTVHGAIIDELNLSCDPQAAAQVLAAPCPVTVTTAQSCLPAFFTMSDFEEAFGAESWLCKECAPWFQAMEDWCQLKGFACWDVVAAATLTYPELFCPRTYAVTINERLLSAGYLERAAGDAPQATVNAPTIADAHAFAAAMLASWQRGLAACPGLRTL